MYPSAPATENLVTVAGRCRGSRRRTGRYSCGAGAGAGWVAAVAADSAGFLRHVDRLADRAGQVRLDRRHHPDVAHRADRALAHGAVEDLVVFGSQAGGVDHVAVLGDVLGDRLDLLVRVAEVLQRPRHGLVDDLHGAAADQLLELDQGQVGLDAGGVAVHHQPDGPGRREQAGLRVPVAVGLARLDARLPGRAGQVEDLALDRAGRADLLTGVGVLADDPLVRLGVARVAVVGADGRGELGRGRVGGPGHQRGDRGGDGPAALGVVGVPGGHQQRAEVGVADAQLAVGAGGLADLLGREVGEADRDVHRGDDQLRDFREARGVEGVVVAEELEQVDAGQVATGVVQVDVLAARVAGADPARLRAGVPVVDGAVVLDAGVGAVPGGLGHAAHQLARVDPLDYLAGAPGQQVELLAFLERAHELVGDPDRVVGVLVLDADDVLAAQVHVEPGVAERADLVFLTRLGLDELGHVGVVHIKDHHLGRAAGGTARLDRAGRGVGAAHERDRAAGGAAGGQQFLARADLGQVDPGSGAALEDQPFFPVPLQDRVHGVVDGQDEARG